MTISELIGTIRQKAANLSVRIKQCPNHFTTRERGFNKINESQNIIRAWAGLLLKLTVFIVLGKGGLRADRVPHSA